ncbi:MAG: response regulator transcription factor [Candidatus Glassbacteria bacterium]
MKKRILIVDDEPSILETIKFHLEMSEYEVIPASDGMEALKLARAENPDLILLDLMLPRIDGYKVCKMLKMDRRFQRIPVVMLTAKAGSVDEIEGYQSGADAYLKKPFDLEALSSVVQDMLEKCQGSKN